MVVPTHHIPVQPVAAHHITAHPLHGVALQSYVQGAPTVHGSGQVSNHYIVCPPRVIPSGVFANSMTAIPSNAQYSNTAVIRPTSGPSVVYNNGNYGFHASQSLISSNGVYHHVHPQSSVDLSGVPLKYEECDFGSTDIPLQRKIGPNVIVQAGTLFFFTKKKFIYLAPTVESSSLQKRNIVAGEQRHFADITQTWNKTNGQSRSVLSGKVTNDTFNIETDCKDEIDYFCGGNAGALHSDWASRSDGDEKEFRLNVNSQTLLMENENGESDKENETQTGTKGKNGSDRSKDCNKSTSKETKKGGLQKHNKKLNAQRSPLNAVNVDANNAGDISIDAEAETEADAGANGNRNDHDNGDGTANADNEDSATLFTINGERGTKEHFLSLIHNKGPDVFDCRLLHSMRCNLQDLLAAKVVNALSRHKYGSRYLQKCIEQETATIDNLRELCNVLLANNNGSKLCTDTIGNFVILKLLEVTCEKVEEHEQDKERGGDAIAYISDNDENEENLSTLAIGHTYTEKHWKTSGKQQHQIVQLRPKENKEIAELKQLGGEILEKVFVGNVKVLSEQEYSCRVIQRILRYRGYLQVKLKILSEIQDAIALDEYIRHPFGNHVVQKCIEKIPCQYLDVICENIASKCFAYSIHIYGCRVVQRLLSHCNERQTASTYKTIVSNAVKLAKNQFGNYVVQHVLNICKNHKIISEMIQAVSHGVFALSCHKFASNVVERCLRLSNGKDRTMLIQAVLLMSDKGQGNANHKSSSGRSSSQSSNVLSDSSASSYSMIAKMVQDQYGNYVLQTLFDVCDSQQKRQLISQIQRFVPRSSLLKLSWGKHIMTKMEMLSKDSSNHNYLSWRQQHNRGSGHHSGVNSNQGSNNGKNLEKIVAFFFCGSPDFKSFLFLIRFIFYLYFLFCCFVYFVFLSFCLVDYLE
ncbi:hypothetical protein RFI_06433 [Reticulomyxa filosa]|uniref:PUM-HD domain-containing protein n=1 Tax=Reticulomyxa filosa TaxID=46433 RepID=X6NZH3_RETFI|nr:hypothetical protein RFI_06433 [Reticulomyxa filosa]|eukprot:ETO30687.1 hypothetical protein RFI_06433 [Reticulomyxa filosa]